ncbi:hypothetical protein EGW08_003499 [Elysia chlorotica]|uniref:Uncharacterized protein n=1 Tax=Elysia chlorotica TaxID=188477 RepID=A0A433U4N1_ELYCH|nr:hypothetical protein EGW08_003499 [Elysia chlorotica]
MTNNLSLLIAAALLAVAWATPCTDVCYGTCDVSAEGSRTFLPFFGAFVEPNREGCRAVCAATCNCIDTCGEACGANLASCREMETSGFIHFLWCQAEFTACNAVCGTQCGMTITAGIMSRALNVVLPPPEV